MKENVFWDVALCSLAEVYQCFRGTCCLHHHGNECPTDKVARTSEMLAKFYKTTYCNTPEDCQLHSCYPKSHQAGICYIQIKIPVENVFLVHFLCIWSLPSCKFNVFISKSSPATLWAGAWGERRYSSYSFLTLALVGGEWSAGRPGHAFTPGERAPGNHCSGGWVGPRASLDAETRGKILSPCRGSNSSHPARSQSLYWLSYLVRLFISTNENIYTDLFIIIILWA
jgi:hypothetical protein